MSEATQKKGVLGLIGAASGLAGLLPTTAPTGAAAATDTSAAKETAVDREGGNRSRHGRKRGIAQ